MNFKNIFKALAVACIACLPFAIASCGDDEPEGPITYTYKWDFTNLSIDAAPNDSVQDSWIAARKSINNQIATAYGQAGFQVQATEKQFTIELEPDVRIEPKDELVEETFLALKRSNDFQTQAAKLPSDAGILIKRDRKTVVERTLQ